jgi:hypothetical protein
MHLHQGPCSSLYLSQAYETLSRGMARTSTPSADTFKVYGRIEPFPRNSGNPAVWQNLFQQPEAWSQVSLYPLSLWHHILLVFSEFPLNCISDAHCFRITTSSHDAKFASLLLSQASFKDAAVWSEKYSSPLSCLIFSLTPGDSNPSSTNLLDSTSSRQILAQDFPQSPIACFIDNSSQF